MSVFTTLDENYYRALDERNYGFTGYIEIDELYEQNMVMGEIFPELNEMFQFPDFEGDSMADDEDSEDEEDDEHEITNGNQMDNGFDNRLRSKVDYDE
jgi:hypothetical protein